MLVAIPSKGRPYGVKSQAIIPSAVVFCPKAEVSEYQAAGVKNVVGVPDSVRGITITRNWILDNASDDRVVMVDDDAKAVGFIEYGCNKVQHKKVKDILAEFVRLFEVTEELNYRIWGVATHSAPQAVYPWKPFLFHTYVTASCMGIRNDTGIRFDESFPVKEDYELCLRCIKEDGGVVGARYLYWENSHWGDEGGCKSYRTGEMETMCIDKLIKLYGGMIRRVTRQGTDYSIALDF